MSSSKKNIVLIHGLWMTPLSWEYWVRYYEERGHSVFAWPWPGLERDIATLRDDPSSSASLGIAEIVDHYEARIRRLETPPIIMGHSFGGLITQILLDRGLGCAGVAIASAPVKGIIFLPLSTIRVVLPALRNPANNHRAAALSPEQFHYAFTNTLTEEESLQVYDRYAVPGPDHILFQAAFANFNPHAATTVDVENANRAPLLLIAGEKDHISPPAVIRATQQLYRKSSALTEYKEFPERTHFILGQAGWEEVAEYALTWSLRKIRGSGARESNSEVSVAGPGR